MSKPTTLTYSGLVLALVLAAPSVWGQTEGARVEAEAGDFEKEGVFNRPLQLSLRAGALGYQDSAGDYTARAAEGLRVDVNVLGFLGDMPDDRVIMGLGSGLLFSHIGAAGSNLFGTEDADVTEKGANAFLVPMQYTAGYRLTDRISVLGHAGGSLLYRSIGSAMQVGRDGDASTDDEVDVFPSLGLTAGWDLTKRIALSLQGEYIGTPADDLFTGTLGATFSI